MRQLSVVDCAVGMVTTTRFGQAGFKLPCPFGRQIMVSAVTRCRHDGRGAHHSELTGYRPACGQRRRFLGGGSGRNCMLIATRSVSNQATSRPVNFSAK